MGIALRAVTVTALEGNGQCPLPGALSLFLLGEIYEANAPHQGGD
jgi:hypothetical protein